MRVRLLLDTDLTSVEVTELQEVIDKQPSGIVQIEGVGILGARLMGAQPVKTSE